jgi:hypothetical protein
MLADARTGKIGRHRLVAKVRVWLFCRLRGCE